MAVAEFNIGLMIAVARKLTLSSTGLAKGEHVGPAVDDIYNVPDVKNVTFGPLDENHPFTDLLLWLHLLQFCQPEDMDHMQESPFQMLSLSPPLQNKTIGGAAVDVYWQEPVPANHPLLSMRNVVCTPHMAGLTTDVDNWSGEMMAQEVLAYLEGNERKYIWKR